MFIYVTEVERRQLVFSKITWKSYDGNFMFKDSKKRITRSRKWNKDQKERKLKKDMQGATKLHKKTKEGTTRPDLKLEFNSCAPAVYAFPAPLVATIMLLIFKTLMASHKRVGVIVIAIAIVFYATFSNISDISL
jgi:hypothetical protein